MSPLGIIEHVIQGQASAILQTPSDMFSNEVERITNILNTPELYFMNPLSLVLSEPSDMVVFEIASRQAKTVVRTQVEDYLQDRVNAACMESAVILFEELFMNAFIDAPRESLKNNKDADLSRSCFLRLAIDDSRIAISMQDPFGSLDINKLLKRMLQVYEQGAGNSINLSQPGGAGIGCVLMFENSASLAIGVDRGVQTTVTAQLYRKINRREKESVAKSIFLIDMENKCNDESKQRGSK